MDKVVAGTGFRTRAACAAVLLLMVGCTKPPPLPGKPRTIDITMRDYKFEHPKTLQPGALLIKAANKGLAIHQLLLIQIPPNVPDLDEQLRGAKRAASRPVAFVQDRKPGETGIFALDLKPGRYGLICFVTEADGVQHTLKGMSSELRVVAP